MEDAHRNRFKSHFPTAAVLEEKVDKLDENVRNLTKRMGEFEKTMNDIGGKLDTLIALLHQKGGGITACSSEHNDKDKKEEEVKKQKLLHEEESNAKTKKIRSATDIMMSACKAVSAPSPFNGYQKMSISSFVEKLMTEAQIKVTEDVGKSNPLKIEGTSKNENGIIKSSLRLIGWCIESEENYNMYIKKGSIPVPGGGARRDYIRKCNEVSKLIARDVIKQLKKECKRKKTPATYDVMKFVVAVVKDGKKHPWEQVRKVHEIGNPNSTVLKCWNVVHSKKRN